MHLKAPSLIIKHITEQGIMVNGESFSPDPKMAWSLLGPNKKSNSKTIIRVGFIGDNESIEHANAFFENMRNVTRGLKPTPLHLSFPGLDKLDIVFEPCGVGIITRDELKKLENTATLSERVLLSLEIIRKKIISIKNEEPTPDLLVLIYPKLIDQYCVEEAIGKRQIHRKSRLEKKIERDRKIHHPLDDFLGITSNDTSHNSINLYELVKFECMKNHIPIQIIRPSTCEPYNKSKREDDATVFWNLAVSMFYKGNHLPWIVAGIDPKTCYIGISFFRDRGDPANVNTALAQVFLPNSDGFVMKSSHAERDSRHVLHVKSRDATSIVKKAIDAYKDSNKNQLPSRIVVHKSSGFDVTEKEGFLAGAETIECDLLSFGSRGTRMVRWGTHPPIRGTMVRMPDRSMLLYTTGYIPYLGMYPGPRIPKPLEIIHYYGNSNMDDIGKEILALSRLNWNSAKFCVREPITLAFSRNVGKILREIPVDINSKDIESKFKYYM